jgi:hypothetical protein
MANEKIIGIKNDFADGKLRWSLLPLDGVEEIVKVLEHGAKKYSVDNWKYVENGVERYWDSLVRHIMAWKKGEIIDPESGFSHLAHAGCNVLFLLHLVGEGQKAIPYENISKDIKIPNPYKDAEIVVI